MDASRRKGELVMDKYDTFELGTVRQGRVYERQGVMTAEKPNEGLDMVLSHLVLEGAL